MEHNFEPDSWRSQSPVTDVGAFGKAIDEVPADILSIREASRELVAHYMGANDGSSPLIIGERLKEADSRYTDVMLERILKLGIPKLSRKRPPEERIAGCCRDYAVLFVSMARHKGIASRVRVGYANYFQPGWYLDHVIAEVWDSSSKRWKLVEPEVGDTIVAREKFDPLDVPPARFVTGPLAWLAARSHGIDPERFVVAPDLNIPYTRSWLSLRHHLVQDLAALNKQEMLVWDQWGILNEDDPLAHADMLDQLSRVIANPDCSMSEISKWSRREGLNVTPKVLSYSPIQFDPVIVDVSRVVENPGR